MNKFVLYIVCVQLEMEKALLEGEHADELQLLHEEQSKIDRLKKKQIELIEGAASQKEKVMEYELYLKLYERIYLFCSFLSIAIVCINLYTKNALKDSYEPESIL